MEASIKTSIKCENCGTKYSVPENYQGRKIQCRRCHKFIFLKDESGVHRISTERRTVTRPSGSGEGYAEAASPKKFPVVQLAILLVGLVAVGLAISFLLKLA